MALKSSTGLKNAVLATSSFKAALNGGKVRIFAGALPADADAAETGTLLCEVSLNGTATGLTFAAAAAAGTISKAAAEVWSGTNVATGTATHYRFVAPGDTGSLSTSEARLQGTVGLIGADLNISNTNLTSGAPQTIDYYTATLL